MRRLQVNALELHSMVSKSNFRSERADGTAMRLGVLHGNLALPVRVGCGPGGVQGEIQFAAERILKAEGALQLGDVGIVHGSLHLELRSVREIALIQPGRTVE